MGGAPGDETGERPRACVCQVETSAEYHFVILSEAKDLVFTHSYEIRRSLCSLRMTGERTFAEVSSCAHLGNLFLVGADPGVRPVWRANPRVRPDSPKAYFLTLGAQPSIRPPVGRGDEPGRTPPGHNAPGSPSRHCGSRRLPGARGLNNPRRSSCSL
jgi:hypothetical protein